jgi:hypothetical protein
MGRVRVKSKLNLSAKLLPLIFATSCGMAQATLPLQGRDIDGNAVDASASNAVFEYDVNLNVTWVLSANAFGPMTWNQAMTWASTLKVGSFEGWSLPSALNQDGSEPCEGFNCVGSQLGYLINVEKYLSADTYRLLLNTSQGSNFYWTSTHHELLSDFVYGMRRNSGEQLLLLERSTDLGDVMVMRPGDVATSVPEPPTASLVLAGLAVSALALRRRTH